MVARPHSGTAVSQIRFANTGKYLKMPTLLLVDGSSYLYRAFHALPDLRNKAGEPTGAIYGVINMLRRLAADYKADYLACVFDAKGKTFRDDWYPQYKAHRPPMPDDLVRQIEPLHACVKALGWPLLAIDGVEADDVIGTLTQQATLQKIDCVVSTGDKDLAQLVNVHVKLVNTMTNETLDEAGVTAKFGVPPARIVDYLALVGDAVDNVPGVEKVGPKTALKWLQQYGSLDDIIAHADDIGGAVGGNLRRALSFLPLGRKLLTVDCNLGLPVGPTDLVPGERDGAKLAELFARLEFRTWLRELQGSGEETPAVAGSASADDPPAAPADGAHRTGYRTVLDWQEFDAWLRRIESAPLTSIDTETTSLDPLQARLVGISFAATAGEAAYLPLGHVGPAALPQLPLDEVLRRLRPWLESAHHAKLGQNLKYDKHVFANHGIALGGIVHDTLLQSYVLESDKSHDMDSLAARHLGIKTITYDEVTGKGASRIGFEQVDVARAAEYAAEDADVTLRLHQAMYPRLEAEERLARLYRDIEMPAMEVLFVMERTGVLIDADLLARQSQELGTRLMQIEAQAHAVAK
jgi:DNA polymerase-1